MREDEESTMACHGDETRLGVCSARLVVDRLHCNGYWNQLDHEGGKESELWKVLRRIRTEESEAKL